MIGGAIVFMWAVSISIVMSLRPTTRAITAPVFIVGDIAFTGLMILAVWKCQYVVESEVLKIQAISGTTSIEIMEICEVAPSRELTSSPALSLDRLKITYRSDRERREILISPMDKDGFLKAFAEGNPELRFCDGKLGRT